MEEKELKWNVSESPYYERSTLWYIIAGILGILLLIYAVITGNFLFAVIVILAILISILSSQHKTDEIELKITEDGVKLDSLFYPWEKFQSFWTVKDEEGKNLGLDLKNWLKTDIYVPIKDHSLEDVEKIISKHLKKNKERKEEPLSYFIARKLKI